MRSNLILFRLLIVFLCMPMGIPAFAGDWPQYRYDAMRTAHSPEEVDDPPYRVKWEVDLLAQEKPETVHSAVQVIAADGRCFVGSREGIMHAFDLQSGKELWRFGAGAGIVHTAAVDDKNVYFATIKGQIFAVNVTKADLAWTFDSKSRVGFSTAVLLTEGKVIAAARDGAIYAVDTDRGKQVWKHSIGYQVYHCPAYAKQGDKGMIFVGAHDMRVHCLDLESGNELWASPKLHGIGFFHYSPVCIGSKVVVRTWNPFGRVNRLEQQSREMARLWEPFTGYYWIRDRSDKFLHETLPAKREMLNSGRIEPDKWPEFYEAQDRIVELYKKRPELTDFFILDQQTGQKVTLAVRQGRAITGDTAPPCVDRDGLLVAPEVMYTDCYGRIEPETGKLVDLLFDVDGMVNAPERNTWYAARMLGSGNDDENLQWSSAGNKIFLIHHHGGIGTGVHWTGSFDLDKRKWWGPFGGGYARNNTQCAGNPIAVSGGVLLHQSFNVIVARTKTTETAAPRRATGRGG